MTFDYIQQFTIVLRNTKHTMYSRPNQQATLRSQSTFKSHTSQDTFPCIRKGSQTCTHMHTCTHAHTHKLTCTNTCAHAHHTQTGTPTPTKHTATHPPTQTHTTHKHAHTHAHTHACTTHTWEQGTWMCTFASCSSSLGTISSCFICFSSFSSSASKSDLTYSSSLISSSSSDSLVLDSDSSWVAVSCCAQENVFKRDTHNKGPEGACTCALKACTSRSLRRAISSCCCLSTSRLDTSLVLRATLSMKRLATFRSRSFTLSSSSPTLDCNSSVVPTLLPSGGMITSSDCTWEQVRHHWSHYTCLGT